MSIFKALVFSLLFWLVPAQASQNSRLVLEQYDTCAGLSNPECCEQMVAYSSFRATGQQLPKLTESTVRLSCNDKEQLASPAACKSVAFSRGLSAKTVKLICETAQVRKECAGSEFCHECTAELKKLDYLDAHWICYAATYREKPRSPRGAAVVEINDEPKNAAPDATVVVIKRRRELR